MFYGADLSQMRLQAELLDRAGVGIRRSARSPGGWDTASQVLVDMPAKRFASLSSLAVLAGGSLLLIQSGQGWDLLANSEAELIGPERYCLTGLLRGLSGQRDLTGSDRCDLRPTRWAPSSRGNGGRRVGARKLKGAD